jgi:hypothetical protein
MIIDECFKELEKIHNGNLATSTSTWFNGHCNLPLVKYKLSIKLQSSNIIIDYEYRSNEFSNSSTIDGGAFKDRHIANIYFYIKNQIPFFEVRKRSLFNRLFNKNVIPNFIIKCKSPTFKKELYQSKNLHEIYKVVESSAEFHPLFHCIRKEGQHVIEIKYNTSKFDREVIECLISFCEEISL